MASPEIVTRRGWSVLRMTSDTLVAEIVPGKGGDILSLRLREDGTELLWQSPWGLRARGAATTGEHDVARLIEAYPGGWQTVFPNGGDAVTEHGVGWGMHGEVWLTPFDREPVVNGVQMWARLVRSPFEVVKRIVLDGAELAVTETVTNVGGDPVEVMWSHHPAFGAPLIGADTVIESAARTFIVDDVRDTPPADLALGARGDWPHVPGRTGGSVDVSRLPGPGAGVERMGYLTDFTRGQVVIRNPRLGLSAALDWDSTLFPHAWYWFEGNATRGFPWYRSAYVLAIEPATSMPGQGIAAVREKNGSQISIGSGESRTIRVGLTVACGESR